MRASSTIAAILLAACAVPGPREARPNIVFVLVDDLGWTDLGCYGTSFYRSPNVDALAARGMRFTDAYAACPVCSPTRASILTGKYPQRMGTTDYFGARPRRNKPLITPETRAEMPLEELTLAEALRAAGYRTAFFGKWHLGGEGFDPELQGFERNIAGYRAGHPTDGYFSPWNNPKLQDGPPGEYLTDRLGDEAVRFLEEVAGEPFLLYLSFYSVHTPLQGKPDLVREYEARKDALPEPEGPRFLPEGDRRARQVQDHPTYAAMVQSMDENVGKVLAALRRLGLEDDTVVVFTSDNGGLSTSEGHPTSNLPLRAGKGWLYEGGIREPMIVAWPGVVEPGSVSSEPVLSTDFYPTLLEIAGLPARSQQHLDGVSFVGLLRGAPRPAHPRPLFWHYPHYSNQGGRPGGAVRLGDWKLIEHYEDGRLELFHLPTDPGEREDLSLADPGRVRDLHGLLQEWRRRVGAVMPVPRTTTDAGQD